MHRGTSRTLWREDHWAFYHYVCRPDRWDASAIYASTLINYSISRLHPFSTEVVVGQYPLWLVPFVSPSRLVYAWPRTRSAFSPHLTEVYQSRVPLMKLNVVVKRKLAVESSDRYAVHYLQLPVPSEAWWHARKHVCEIPKLRLMCQTTVILFGI